MTYGMDRSSRWTKPYGEIRGELSEELSSLEVEAPLRALGRRVMAVLPRSRAARVLVFIIFLDAFGRGFFLTGSALFYTQVIGLGTTQIGFGLSLAGALGVLCSAPIGWMSDRLGDRRTLVALQLWRAAAFLIYPFVSNFPMFLVVACWIGVVESAVAPIIQSLAGATAEEGSLVDAMAVLAVSRNGGYALAALAATAVLTAGGSATYIAFSLVNALGFVVTAGLLARLRIARKNARATDPSRAPPSRLQPFKNARFLLLSLSNGILFLHMPILTVGFPLWVITRTQAPKGIVGVAIVLNSVLTMALQMRLSKGGDEVARASRMQRMAGAVLAAFCVMMALTRGANVILTALLLLLAIVPLTLGEIWQQAGGWGISYRFAPEEQRTYYLSVFQFGATGAAVVGSAILTIAVINTGPMGWLGLGVVFAITGIAVPLLAKASLSS